MDTSTAARSEARRSATRYSLGSDDHEIARLDSQAAWLDAATRVLLGAAGIGPGMRVLDLGTGLGHVAMVAADRSTTTWERCVPSPRNRYRRRPWIG